MIRHPNASLPEEDLHGAYADLLALLAHDEPEALDRAARTLDAGWARHAGALTGGSPAARLARTWLAFTGKHQPAAAPGEGRSFQFTHPAHVAFQVAGAASPEAAQRIAARAVAALAASDIPIGAIDGPLPAEPSIANVVVWIGSVTGVGDLLELES